MVKNEGQRCINSLFQTISSEKRMQIVETGVAQMRESNKETTMMQHHVVCKKRNAQLVGLKSNIV
jgi:hypothetical protein